MKIVKSYTEKNDYTIFCTYDIIHNGHKLGEFWFNQFIDTGNIYEVYIDLINKYNDFEIHINSKHIYYPNEFTLRIKTRTMDVEEISTFQDRVSEVSDILNELKKFFENSTHYHFWENT